MMLWLLFCYQTACTVLVKAFQQHPIHTSKNCRHVGLALQSSPSSNNRSKPRIAIVGGGWAGYTAAESLSTNNIYEKSVEIILLDASKSGGGLAGGYREGNRPVEAGIHGFWREYKNTFSVMAGINGLNIDEVLGDYTPSVLYSKNGKVAVAPVLYDEDGNETVDLPLNEERIRRLIAGNLPAPLDLPVLAKLDEQTSNLTPLDLLSGLGLLGAWADFEQESKTSWKNYDTQPASLLFQEAGITDNLYEELVSPLLHVLPMCPAYDCSAAAALSCFHVFALQTKGAFDVRWCRGSIGEKIFDPWRRQLEDRSVEFRNGAKVVSITRNNIVKEGTDEVLRQYTVQLDSNDGDTIQCDAVILSVGAVAAKRLVKSSPDLSSLPATENFDKLRGVTCVAVRIFLKPHTIVTKSLRGGAHSKSQLPPDMTKAMLDSPIAVCGAGIIPELKETGFCIYDLQRMHDEFSVEFYETNSVARDEQVAVLEVDFYRADSFVDMDDNEITDLTLRAVSATLRTDVIKTNDVVESKILRARNAVSHFYPKSAFYSPDVKLSKQVRVLYFYTYNITYMFAISIYSNNSRKKENIYMAGDWIDRAGHSSWSTEKSVVTARQAARALSKDFQLKQSACNVIPVALDTPQLTTLRYLAKVLRTVIPPKTLPPSPWVLAKKLLSGEV